MEHDLPDREVTMEINQFVWDVVDSNSWLIVEDNAGLLIDAIDSPDLYSEIEKLDDLTIILTHSHFDHIYGLNKIRDIYPDAKVLSTKLCSEYLGNVYKNMSSSATAFMVFYSGRNDVQIDPVVCEAADVTFEDNYIFLWKGHNVKLEAFRGHTADSLIAVVDEDSIFSGDTLLSIPTVTRFPSGSTEKFWKEDVPRLKELVGGIVYPGHRTSGVLEDMLAVNKMPGIYMR